MRFKKVLAVLLALAAVLFVLAACRKKDHTSPTETDSEQTDNHRGGANASDALTLADVPRPAAPAVPAAVNPASLNETRTLLMQAGTFGGVYNPFFYTNAHDGDVVRLVNVGLVTLDPSGAVVAGTQYDTYGQSYEIYYTDNPDTLAKKSTFEEGDYVVYEVVLKNGAFFSDGTLMTADDVLFNYYVLLDPRYDGSSTLCTLPVVGLNDYRTQVKGYDAVVKAAQAALTMGPAYVASPHVSAEQHAFYWAAMEAQLTAFAQSIVDYVVTVPGYVTAYVNPAWTDVSLLSVGQKVAAGMVGWGFGSIAGDTLTTAFGKVFNDMNTVTIADYVSELVSAYVFGDDYAAEYANLDNAKAAGVHLLAPVEETFVAQFGDSGTAVAGIAGLRKGVKGVVENGETVAHETFILILSERNPKAAPDLCVPIAPKAYYTAGYEYPTDAVVNYGVEYNSKAFMDSLKTLNHAPMGAGAYQFVSADADGVTLVRNDYHFTLGDDHVTNARIKNVRLKTVASGHEFGALLAGDVDCSGPLSDADVLSDLAKPENAKYAAALVDSPDYVYICINPAAPNLDNLHTRIALTSVMDLEKVGDDGPNGLYEVIYRSAPRCSRAYPENAQAIYPFDEDLSTAIDELKLAGYTFDENTGQFTNAPVFTFTVPATADFHPAYVVFRRAQELLATIGVEANVVTDANLAANVKKSPVAVYALTRQTSADPDMYPFELPAYRIKNVFAYDRTVMDATSLTFTATPYRGQVAEIRKISYIGGDRTRIIRNPKI